MGVVTPPIYRHCMKEPHEPTSCELWERWKEVVSRMTNGEIIKSSLCYRVHDTLPLIPNTCTHCLSYPPPHHPHTPHTLDDEAKKVASQAQADARWIIRNTKPCPHCRYVGIEYRTVRVKSCTVPVRFSDFNISL